MTSRPALVIVTSSFPTSGDGSEAAGSFVADLVEELASQLPVRVVAPGQVNRRESGGEGVEIFRYAAPEKALSTLRIWHPIDAVRVLRVLCSGQQATEMAISAGSTAHVLALWALPCGYWARRSARRHAIRYSVWTLGSDIWSLGRIPLVRRVLRRVLRDADKCWSDGLKLRDDTKAIAGRPIEFIPSTRRIDRIRTEPLRPAPPYRLLFLGRWHPNKGIDLLLDALTLLQDDDWPLIERVTIAGGGPLEPIVKAGVQRLRAEGRPVDLRGHLRRDEAQQAILDSDYLLIPSRIESIPVVFSDAMKLGCPIVATPVGDFPRLLAEDLSCGLLARRGDAKSYAEALRAALRSSPLRHEKGVCSMAERFDLAMIAGRLADVSHA